MKGYDLLLFAVAGLSMLFAVAGCSLATGEVEYIVTHYSPGPMVADCL